MKLPYFCHIRESSSKVECGASCAEVVGSNPASRSKKKTGFRSFFIY